MAIFDTNGGDNSQGSVNGMNHHFDPLIHSEFVFGPSSGLTLGDMLQKSLNLSDVEDTSVARNNLGIVNSLVLKQGIDLSDLPTIPYSKLDIIDDITNVLDDRYLQSVAFPEVDLTPYMNKDFSNIESAASGRDALLLGNLATLDQVGVDNIDASLTNYIIELIQANAEGTSTPSGCTANSFTGDEGGIFTFDTGDITKIVLARNQNEDPWFFRTVKSYVNLEARLKAIAKEIELNDTSLPRINFTLMGKQIQATTNTLKFAHNSGSAGEQDRGFVFDNSIAQGSIYPLEHEGDPTDLGKSSNRFGNTYLGGNIDSTGVFSFATGTATLELTQPPSGIDLTPTLTLNRLENGLIKIGSGNSLLSLRADSNTANSIIKYGSKINFQTPATTTMSFGDTIELAVDMVPRSGSSPSFGTSVNRFTDAYFEGVVNTDKLYINQADQQQGGIEMRDPALTDPKNAYIYIGDHLGLNRSMMYIGARGGEATAGIILDQPGNISTNRNIGSVNFFSGFAGSGWRIQYDGANDADATFDNLTVRKRMRVYELEVSRIRASNGSIWVSDSMEVQQWVETSTTGTFKFWGDKEVIAYPTFVENDLVRAQQFDGRNVLFFEGKVTAIGTDTAPDGTTDTPFAIVERRPETTDTPWDGMGLVRMGNTTDTDRQGALYLTSSDDQAPFMDVIDGVDSFLQDPGDFSPTTKARLGKLDGITWEGQALSGYGLFSENVFLSGYIQALRGNIGGWIIDTEKFYRYFGESNTYINFGEVRKGVPKSSGDPHSQLYGVEMAIDSGNYISFFYDDSTPTKYFALEGKTDGDVPMFRLDSRDGESYIGGWRFYQTLLEENSGRIQLDSNSRFIRAIKNQKNEDGTPNLNGGYVSMFYTSDTSWGLTGYTGTTNTFQLGSTNRIAGWNFDGSYLWCGTKKTTDGFANDGITFYGSDTNTSGLGGAIRSKNFRIDRNGDAFFNGNGTFSGTVYATDGSFTGTVYATDGEFTGTISANDGNIGGWLIDNEGLSKQGEETNAYLRPSEFRFSRGNPNAAEGGVIESIFYISNTSSDFSMEAVDYLKYGTGRLTRSRMNFDFGASRIKSRSWMQTDNTAASNTGVTLPAGTYTVSENIIVNLTGNITLRPVADGTSGMMTICNLRDTGYTVSWSASNSATGNAESKTITKGRFWSVVAHKGKLFFSANT